MPTLVLIVMRFQLYQCWVEGGRRTLGFVCSLCVALVPWKPCPCQGSLMPRIAPHPHLSLLSLSLKSTRSCGLAKACSASQVATTQPSKFQGQVFILGKDHALQLFVYSSLFEKEKLLSAGSLHTVHTTAIQAIARSPALSLGLPCGWAETQGLEPSPATLAGSCQMSASMLGQGAGRASCLSRQPSLLPIVISC